MKRRERGKLSKKKETRNNKDKKKNPSSNTG
jgi:hypothetical protein